MPPTRGGISNITNLILIASTAHWAASRNQWNLPRAKKCPPDTFCTSALTGAALSIPSSRLHHKKCRPKAAFFMVEPMMLKTNYGD